MSHDMQDLFGSDEESEDEPQRRSLENGILQFHAGTEEMMWLHVQKAQPTNRAELLQVVDEFCYER